MRKTSVYLTDAEITRLGWLAERERTSQAEIIRKAIASYEPDGPRDRNFAGAGSFDGPGDSVADYDEDELLEGFGEDSLGG
jgi:hypothetical protein